MQEHTHLWKELYFLYCTSLFFSHSAHFPSHFPLHILSNLHLSSLLFDQGSEAENTKVLLPLTEIYLIMKIPKFYLLILVIGLTSRTGVTAAPTLQSAGSNLLPVPIKLLRAVRSPVPFDEDNQPESLNFDDMRMIQRLASIVPYIKFSDKRSGKQFFQESNKWFCSCWFLKRSESRARHWASDDSLLIRWCS